MTDRDPHLLKYQESHVPVFSWFFPQREQASTEAKTKRRFLPSREGFPFVPCVLPFPRKRCPVWSFDICQRHMKIPYVFAEPPYQGCLVASRATSPCHVRRGISPWKICTNFCSLCSYFFILILNNFFVKISLLWEKEIRSICKRKFISEKQNVVFKISKWVKPISSL